LSEWEGLVADVERAIRELKNELVATNKLLKSLLITMLLYEVNNERRRRIIELIRKSEDRYLDEILELLRKED